MILERRQASFRLGCSTRVFCSSETTCKQATEGGSIFIALTTIRLVDKDNATKISLIDQKLGTVQKSLDDMPKAVEGIIQTSQGAVLREIGTNSHHLDENTQRLEQNLDFVKHDVLQGVTAAEASTHRLLQSLKGDIVDEIVLDRTSRSSESQALHSQLASMQQMMSQILVCEIKPSTSGLFINTVQDPEHKSAPVIKAFLPKRH